MDNRTVGGAYYEQKITLGTISIMQREGFYLKLRKSQYNEYKKHFQEYFNPILDDEWFDYDDLYMTDDPEQHIDQYLYVEIRTNVFKQRIQLHTKKRKDDISIKGFPTTIQHFLIMLYDLSMLRDDSKARWIYGGDNLTYSIKVIELLLLDD